MDYDLYIRTRYNLVSRDKITLPYDKKRIFTRETISSLSDIDMFAHSPGWGDVWVYEKDNIIEQILPFNSFLYRHASLYNELKLFAMFSCTTNSNNDSLRRMTYGNDTFANLLLNLEYFIEKDKILLVNDIKIPLDPLDGSYKGLKCTINESNHIKRLIIRRSS